MEKTEEELEEDEDKPDETLSETLGSDEDVSGAPARASFDLSLCVAKKMCRFEGSLVYWDNSCMIQALPVASEMKSCICTSGRCARA